MKHRRIVPAVSLVFALTLACPAVGMADDGEKCFATALK